MTIPNRKEFQHVAFIHSSYIDFRDFMNLYKTFTTKTYSFLVIDAILASHNPLCFEKNLLERIWNIIMAIDDKIRDEKLQYDNNREAAKKSAWCENEICYSQGNIIISD